MGKATGILKELSGKIGPLQFQQTKSGKVAVFQAPEVPNNPVRTKKQMELRLAWGNLGAVYSQFHKTLKRSHEGLPAGTSDYNAFIKENTRMTCVYLKKSELANGGCVLAPYKISDGKLPGIYYDADDNGVLVTDIELGGLVIGEDTTVSDFSVAVLTLNDDYEDGDQITFFYGVQMVEQGTGVPRAKIKGQKVKLDVSDDTLLWSCVTGLGFSTVDGYLGMNIGIENGAAAWVHTREDEQGNLKVSAQKLTVDSTVLASYMGNAAFEASVQSYGGITNRKVFLRPDDETNTVSFASLSGGAASQGGGSGSQGGGGSNQNANENQNSGSGGSGSSTTESSSTGQGGSTTGGGSGGNGTTGNGNSGGNGGSGTSSGGSSNENENQNENGGGSSTGSETGGSGSGESGGSGSGENTGGSGGETGGGSENTGGDGGDSGDGYSFG